MSHFDYTRVNEAVTSAIFSGALQIPIWLINVEEGLKIVSILLSIIAAGISIYKSLQVKREKKKNKH